MKREFILMIAVFLPVFAMFGQEKLYKIGDLYDVDGIKGIVFSIEDGGRHGKIVALENSIKRTFWGDPVYLISSGPYHDGSTPTRYYRGRDYEYDGITAEMVAKAFSGATDKNDGAYDCNKIAQNYYPCKPDSDRPNVSLYCNPLSWLVSYVVALPKSEIPWVNGTEAHVFELSNLKQYDASNNWYIPAVLELQELYGACAQDGLNEMIINAGGQPLNGRFWSSTEIPHFSEKFDINYSSCAWAYDMDEGYDFSYDKNGIALHVRVIRRF